MPLFALAATALLLASCTGIREHQERAADFVESAAGNITVTLSGAGKKIKATAAEVQDRAERLQQGVKKVTGAVQDVQEGVAAVKGALNVSGESSEE